MKYIKNRLDESILVCVYYGLNGERLIRRGHKLAKLLDCPLYVLTVDSQPINEFDAEKTGYIEYWRSLIEELEIEEFIVRADERKPIQKVIHEVAEAYNITQIIIGQSAQSRWEEITRGSFLNVLLKEIPMVDLHIVSIQQATEDDSYDLYEKGIRAYLIEDEGTYKVNFVCPKVTSIEGIFFKELGTDFDNGMFKFTADDQLYEIEIVEDEIKHLEKLPTHIRKQLES